MENFHVPQDRLLMALIASDSLSALPELFGILGREKFLEFVDIFGGMVLKIPSRGALQAALRDTTIHQRHSQGVTAEVLSNEYGISVRQVYRIVARVEKALAEGGGRSGKSDG
jgi:Mor family transcriptional regulator